MQGFVFDYTIFKSRLITWLEFILALEIQLYPKMGIILIFNN